MPKISVVIPVYNVEKYLQECLDSVINQTLKDIEIICIDDGSTDSSPQILDEYADNDSRIKVIHKVNEGYGKAMNTGFDMASGEYIGIVESDDFILPEMYETLYNCAVNNSLDAVKSDFYFYWSKANKKILSHYDNIEYYNRIFKGEDKHILFSLQTANWSGIYKKDTIVKNNIRHHETPGASFQDTGFWIQINCMMNSIMIIDKPFYMYRQDNPASSIKQRNKLNDTLNEYEWASDIIKSKGFKEEWKLCKFSQLNVHKGLFMKLDVSLKKEYAEIIKQDYIKYKDIVEPYIKKYGSKENFEFIESIMIDCDNVCDEFIKAETALKEKLECAENIIVYGAGHQANNVILKLHNMKYYNKIGNIAVSDDPKEKEFWGVPLIKIDNISDKNAVVLISVKKDTPAYSEMVKNLNTLGFYNSINTENFNYIFF